MQIVKLSLLAVLALALAGCPEAADDETALEQQTERAVHGAEEQLNQPGQEIEQFGEDTQRELNEFSQRAEQGFEQAAEESKEFADRAGEEIREGYANISEDVQERYPDVVDSIQRQFYAMNAWAVDEYRETFAEDAPRGQQLLDDFKRQVDYRPRYTIEEFEVLSASDKTATARVVFLMRSTDKAAPPGEKRETKIYTFRQEENGDDWVVYDIQPEEMNDPAEKK